MIIETEKYGKIAINLKDETAYMQSRDRTYKLKRILPWEYRFYNNRFRVILLKHEITIEEITYTTIGRIER
jgi:hypothetical protein